MNKGKRGRPYTGTIYPVHGLRPCAFPSLGRFPEKAIFSHSRNQGRRLYDLVVESQKTSEPSDLKDRVIAVDSTGVKVTSRGDEGEVEGRMDQGSHHSTETNRLEGLEVTEDTVGDSEGISWSRLVGVRKR